MAQRNAATGAIEITLCPSGFSQSAINVLTPPASAAQSHHQHHGHHTASLLDQSATVDHSSHEEAGAADLCPLAGSGAVAFNVTAVDIFLALPQGILLTESPMPTRANMRRGQPVRGPPTIS